MSIDFTQKNPPGGPVLKLEQVEVELLPSYDTGISEVSLSVNRGDLVLIRIEQGVYEHPLPDLISGLVPATSGKVHIFGKLWGDLNADHQAKARWRIGRVFGIHGWMSNLDVDENVTLAERHHTSRSLDDIMAEVNRLSKLVGLPGLPEGRPASVERNALRRAAWVRAALGSPWLMVLEFPGHELGRGWVEDLLPLVSHMREQGTAVIWLCEHLDEWNDLKINPSLKLYAEANKLIREG